MPINKKVIVFLGGSLVLLFIVGVAVLALVQLPMSSQPQNQTQETINQNAIEVLGDHLRVPWSIAFLPDGEIMVTERPGTLYFVNSQQRIQVNNVGASGEGGLLGLALHPEFSKNKWLYLYITTKKNNNLVNQVARFTFDKMALSEEKIIVDGIPGSSVHDGGRMAFGPDGLLYITTGDAGDAKKAQDTHSLSGKILRVHDDGSIPADNPFSNAVYSYGHRNPQGLAWDNQGRLFSTEHGRSGILSGFDEVNMIEKGANYGWPDIQGDQTKEGMKVPVIHSGANDTWAPASAAFFDQKIYFGGLRGQTLFVFDFSNGQLQSHFNKVLGRIREVAAGPDGALYLTTSNTDGRGDAKEGDDKLIKIAAGL